MTLHETCTMTNDIALNSPINGDVEIREVLSGTWTRTIITTGCGGGGSGGGSIYGPGGSGNGILVRRAKASEGGTSHRPDQETLVYIGEA